MKSNKVNELPLISVIMCVHNETYSEELEFAIESILNQTYTNLEYIICDDASEQKTWEMLKKYRERDERICLIRNRQNQGVAASLNKCIAIAQGEYIARMDGDDISALNRLEIEYQFLNEHKEYAFVGCNADLIEDQSVWGTRKMPIQPTGKDFLPYSPYIHPTIMGRREFFCHDKGYRVNRYTWRCEDLEFFMRQYSQKKYGYNIQQSLYYYREDMKGYHKRKFRYCLSEAVIRLQGYSRIRMLLKGGLLYWMKPILVGLIPKKLYCDWKRKQMQALENNKIYSENAA